MLTANSKRVLIVEDNVAIHESLKLMLTQSGYIVVGDGYNGQEAVELTQQLQPDVVLLDIVMPDPVTCMEDKQAGLKAARTILTQFPTSVILLTAYETQEFVEQASLSGVGAYLVKPIKFNDLERAITIASARFGDLRELRRLNEELGLSENKLRIANATKNKFFSIIAHDLRHPFVTLLSGFQLIEQFLKEKEIDQIPFVLSELNKSTKNTLQLLENLLDWSRLQRDLIHAKPKQIDLAEIIDTLILPLMKAGAEQKGIELSSRLTTGTFAYGDEVMIETVLRNLVANGLKFTKRGGRIEISARQTGNFMEIAITDTGIGINEIDREYLFDLETNFHKTGTAGEKGTGLGLILCKELVEKNGGRIWAESEAGKGSTFTFTVPISS